MNEIKRIDIQEFVESGYLHEVNRRVLHPLGLALEVETTKQPDDSIRYTGLGGVWDYRHDPEGILYGPDLLSEEKAANVDRLWKERTAAREKLLGFMVQPPNMEAAVLSALLDA